MHGLPQIRLPRPGDIEVSLAVAAALSTRAGSPGPLAVRASFSFKVCFPNKIFFLCLFFSRNFSSKEVGNLHFLRNRDCFVRFV